ncbi:MAG: septum formation initiator family protein [Candidatus Komeilibacteria bacterium]
MVSQVLRSRTFLIIIVIIFIISSFELINEVGRRYKVNQEIKNQQRQIETLKSQNGDLNQLIHYLNTDQFVEEEARSKLGLSKSGESVVVFPSTATPSNEQVVASTSPNNSNTARWWSYFFP